jgi:dTMP kinase
MNVPALGRLLTLEGGEGAGKSSLAKALAAALVGPGRQVITTREPGGTPSADKIRQILVRDEGQSFAPLTEALLFTAARHEHIRQVIAPALARGDWVLCDRYLDSTRAYQAAAGGLGPQVCEALSRMIAAPRPDLTLLLDVAPETGLARSLGRAHGEDRFEKRDLGFHAAVRAAFLEIAAEEPGRMIVIAADQPPQAVLEQALSSLRTRGWL